MSAGSTPSPAEAWWELSRRRTFGLEGSSPRVADAFREWEADSRRGLCGPSPRMLHAPSGWRLVAGECLLAAPSRHLLVCLERRLLSVPRLIPRVRVQRLRGAQRPSLGDGCRLERPPARGPAVLKHGAPPPTATKTCVRLGSNNSLRRTGRDPIPAFAGRRRVAGTSKGTRSAPVASSSTAGSVAWTAARTTNCPS